MWHYLDKIFEWSSDMELIIYDELWETHADDSMTYMLVNKWFGTTERDIMSNPGFRLSSSAPAKGVQLIREIIFQKGIRGLA